MTDEKTTDITFGEFQSWMNGLIEGKRGKLPDLEDWKRIKVMMGRVKPDIETVTVPNNVPYTPYIQPYDTNPWSNPIDPNIWPNQIWCGSSSDIATSNGISLTDVSSSTTTTIATPKFELDMASINKLKTME